MPAYCVEVVSRHTAQEGGTQTGPSGLAELEKTEFEEVKITTICRSKYQQGGSCTEKNLELYSVSPICD